MTDVTQDTAQGAQTGADTSATSQATDATQTSQAAAQASGSESPDPVKLAQLAADLETRLGTLKSESESRAAAHAAAVTALQAERDKLAGERDRIAADLDKLTKSTRETALFDKLFTALPHMDRRAIRGIVRELSEEGRVDRYSEQTDKQAQSILDILKTDSPSMLKAPAVPGGGTNPVKITPQVDPLAAAFGPRGRR